MKRGMSEDECYIKLYGFENFYYKNYYEKMKKAVRILIENVDSRVKIAPEVINK